MALRLSYFLEELANVHYVADSTRRDRKRRRKKETYAEWVLAERSGQKSMLVHSFSSVQFSSVQFNISISSSSYALFQFYNTRSLLSCSQDNFSLSIHVFRRQRTHFISNLFPVYFGTSTSDQSSCFLFALG